MIIVKHFMRQLPSASKIPGFISLINVLSVTTIGATIVISLLWLALGSSDNHLTLLRSMQTRATANACAETALLEIKNNPTYTGSDELTIDNIECSYTVTSQGAQARTISAASTSDGVTRKLKVIIDQVSPTINMTSWQEVADF